MNIEKRKVIQRAMTLTQQGQYDQAIAKYESLLAGDSSDPSLYNALGDLYANIGLTAEAMAYYQKLLDVLKAEGRLHLAIAVCKKIIKLDPKNGTALVICADLYAAEGLRAEAKQHYLLAAERFMKSGSERQALDLFERLIRLEPGDTALPARLASLITREGRGSEGVEFLNHLAQEARAEGRLDSARALYQQMVAITPKSFTGWYCLGRIDFEMGRFEDAEESLRQAASIDVESPLPRFLLAQLYEKQRQPERAKAAWVTLLRCDPKHQEGHQRLAQLYLNEGDMERAANEFDAFAQCLDESGEREQAIVLLDRLGPVADHPLIQERRGDLLAGSGRLTEAKAAFQRAAEMYLARGCVEKCQQILSRLMGLGPGPSEPATCLTEGAGTKSGGVNLEPPDDSLPFSSIAERATSATWPLDSSLHTDVSESEELFRLPVETEEHVAEESFADLAPQDFSRTHGIEAEARASLPRPASRPSDQDSNGPGPASLEPKPLAKDVASNPEIEVLKTDTFEKSGGCTLSHEDSAEQDSGSTADRSPEACEAHYQLGVTLREMGLLDGAIAEFRRSSLDTRLALRAHTMVGLCLLAKGEAEAAIDELCRGLSILGQPPKEYQAVKYDLAGAYQAIGILNAALAILHGLQKESPSLHDVESRVRGLRRRLAQITGLSGKPNGNSDPMGNSEAVGR